MNPKKEEQPNPFKDLCMKDGRLHRKTKVPFATIATPVVVPAWGYATGTLLDIPRIPFKLFRQVVAWQRKIVREHKCESATSLFLIEGEWTAVTFHQSNTNGSMVADVSWTEGKGFMGKENAELLAEYADRSLLHATIHNHVTAGASQSGRDATDEKDLPGPHITIGHLDKDKLDFHGRLSTMVDGKHAFLPLRISDIIDIPLPWGGLKPETLDELEKAWLTFPSYDEEIPEEFADKFHLFVRPTTPTPNYTGGANSTTASSGNLRLEEFLIEHKNEITIWPYGFLDKLPVTTPEAFITSLNGATMTIQSAAVALAESLAPDDENPYPKLYEHMLQRAKDKVPATT